MVLAAPPAFRYGPGRNVPTAAPAGSQSIDRLELHVLIEDGTLPDTLRADVQALAAEGVVDPYPAPPRKCRT